MARWFFIAAALMAIADVLALSWIEDQPPEPTVLAALALAIAGMAAHVAGRAYRLDSRLARALAEAFESNGWSTFAVGVFFLACYGASMSAPTPYTEPVLQAYALLHGHTWVEAPPSYMEHVVWHGRNYLLHPPLAALISVPIVAIWGLATNQTAISVFIGAISLALVWLLLTKMGLDIAARVWMTLFFGLGTTFWYEATLGSSWDFVVLVTVPFTLCALAEAFGKGRPWVVGLFAALAALGRYDMVFAWPCYAGLLWTRRKKTRELLLMLPWMLGALALFVWFNEARFGKPYDIGMWLWYEQDVYRFVRPGGPIALSHLPYNLYTVFFMAPSYSENFPYLHPEYLGQGLMFTSPAFILALRPSFLQPVPMLIALAAALCSGPSMLWYANGFAQLGVRYYVEVFPFLLALMALGAPSKLDQLTKILIVISIMLVAFFSWHVRWYGWGG